ncbi:helix-turn-helix domain-containing protein [Stappia sp.]|uniref:helix-turn-helix domain-containing protein n=1 Tax=Stappia sp. TaxID=1870903 RepID=UPI003C7DC034
MKLALTVSPAQKILHEVALKHQVRRDNLTGPRSFRQYVHARHEAMYRLLVELRWPLTRIGSLLNRDHTTVMHGIGAHCRRNDIPAPRPALAARAARFDQARAA